MAELSVIRPLWWLQGTGAAVGGSIDIGLHEIGLSGEATVLAIGPCDVDSRETRPGMSIVTGTIRHRNATVWDLTFDGRRTEGTLGVTANHPLYSETRRVWIPAGDLQLDEVVRTLNGHSTLTARTQRPTRETVFNLEVHRSHAYHVSAIGVLAHNTGLPCPKTTVIGRMKDLDQFDHLDHVDTWRKSDVSQVGSEVTWQMNKKWLDERIARGDRFVIASDPASLPPRIGGFGHPGGGYFTRLEYDYLLRQGIDVGQWPWIQP